MRQHFPVRHTDEQIYEAIDSYALSYYENEIPLKDGVLEYLTYLKKQNKEVSLEDNEDVLIEKEDIEQLLVNKDLAFKIHQKLHELKEPYKEVFSLRVFGELSFKSIAMIFGKTEHWACVTFHRAKEMIKGGMSDEN